jgi:hypothetical protein
VSNSPGLDGNGGKEQPDWQRREPNHYEWFMPPDLDAWAFGYLDAFEAKMREALDDFYVHDMAQSVLPLIALVRAQAEERDWAKAELDGRLRGLRENENSLQAQLFTQAEELEDWKSRFEEQVTHHRKHHGRDFSRAHPGAQPPTQQGEP